MPGITQRCTDTGKIRLHPIIQTIDKATGRNTDAKCRRAGIKCRHRLTRNDFKHRNRGFKVRRQWPRRVKALCQRMDTRPRHRQARWLKAIQTIDRRWNADGSARIGSKCEINQTMGNGQTAARCRPTGNTLRVKHVARRSVMRVQTNTGIGKLAQRGASKRNRTGFFNPAHNITIFCRWAATFQKFGCRRGGNTGLVIQILDRYQHPRKRQVRRFGNLLFALLGIA